MVIVIGSFTIGYPVALNPFLPSGLVWAKVSKALIVIRNSGISATRENRRILLSICHSFLAFANTLVPRLDPDMVRAAQSSNVILTLTEPIIMPFTKYFWRKT